MKKKLIVLAALLLAAALISWFFYPLRSYIVMGVYSGRHSRESLMKQHGFEVDIPAGQGWYPFMLTYNADGFASWSGLDADMSIVYNFGAFDAATRTSSIYDTGSDKYCAFYGAYVVHTNDGVFGFADSGEPDMDEVTLAVQYDYTQLVIAGFGCNPQVFKVDSFDMQNGLEYAGSSGWTRIDAVITANGVAHSYKESKTAYLQYGPPTQAVEEEFAATTLQGRLYLKYIEEYDCTMMLYVIARDSSVIDKCDTDLLAETTIADLQQ
jgi:hypothetical protein